MKNLITISVISMAVFFSCGSKKEVAPINVTYTYTATNSDKRIDVSYLNLTGGNDESNNQKVKYWEKVFTIQSDQTKQTFAMTVNMYSYSTTLDTDQKVTAKILVDGKEVASKTVEGSGYNYFTITAEAPTTIKYK